MKRILICGAVIAFAISMGVIFTRASRGATEVPAIVFAETIRPISLFESLSYPARVVPKLNTTLLAESDGIVSRIYAPLGQRVGRKQKILEITHTDPVYQYAPIVVLAPVAGVVSAVEVTEGSQVTRGQRLGSVTDPAQIRVTVEVPAQDLRLLSRGMAANLKIAGGEAAIGLRVRGISPFVDPATGTATCELDLADAKPALLGAGLAPGVVGQVSFKAGAHDGILIPDYAVIYRGTDTFVRVIDRVDAASGKARQVPVKLGRKDRGNVEVVDGIKAGTTVVMRSSKYVAEGELVSVQKADASK